MRVVKSQWKQTVRFERRTSCYLDELAPPYSTTSSARATKVCAKCRPIARVALRLTDSVIYQVLVPEAAPGAMREECDRHNWRRDGGLGARPVIIKIDILAASPTKLLQTFLHGLNFG